MAGVSAVANGQAQRRLSFGSGPAVVLYIALCFLALQFLTASRYGYFGDELYHMACGEHLAWGYVDQPPLIAVFAWLTRHMFGTSVFAIRIFPAISGFFLILLTGLICRELGGGRFAQALSASCTACAGIYLILHHLFTMNAFEPLLWMGCAYLVIRIIKTGNQKLWLWFGLLAGIGMENKYSMGVFVFVLLAALILTGERKALASRWVWIGGCIAFLIFLPNLIWNIRNDWPFFELMRNIRESGRDLPFTPVGYIRAQILLMTPFTFPVWLLGTLYFLSWKQARPFRILGYTFIGILVFFIVTHGKDYYASPVFPVIFSGGAIVIEQFSRRNRMAWVRPIVLLFLFLGTAIMLPYFAPVLSPEDYLRYEAKLPVRAQPDEKSMLQEPMPHYYSWCFGWEEMVKAVSAAWMIVPPGERPDTAIFANDFAAAGAIDLIGPRYGLPKAIGGHQTYWMWGPRDYSGHTMILVGSTRQGALRWFSDVQVVAELNNPYAAPWENKPILLCRSPKNFSSLAEIWPKLKNWD